MRQLPFVLCATLFSGYAFAGAPSPLIFTLDLAAPCNQSGCSGIHPTDVGLDLGANSFNFTIGTGGASGASISSLDLTSPVICGEVSSAGLIGPSSSTRFAPMFTNPSPGAQLEFDAGGPSVVDITAVSYDGQTPAGVAAMYSNYGSTLPPQVSCYKINPISGGPVALALGPGAIFKSGFETLSNTHFANEPWVSARSVFSPHASGNKSGGTTDGITTPDTLGFVVEVHNAAQAIGWRLDLGYDHAFFNSGTTAPLWCVLDASTPQPGPINGAPATCGSNSTSHVFVPADIQPGKNSIFVYVEYHGSATAISNWSSLNGSMYPAVAAIFPPFGTYAQRFDDKVAVASANNLPTFNIGSIVCNNDTTSTACTINDQDGHEVPAALTFQNAISGGGAATIDPLAFLVDPNSESTVPGNAAQDTISVSNVSCSDPSQILASSVTGSNFTTSASAQGSKAFNLNFKPSGSPDFPFVAGTATCTATFTSAGYLPNLSATGTFTISMQQAAVGSIAVTAPPAQTAAPGGTVTYTLVVANAGSSALSNVAVSNPIAANVQSLAWTCTPAGGASCPATSGTGAISQSVSTLPVGGSLNYALTATLKSAATFVSAAQVGDAASVSIPGGSCSGGSCSASANVATVPLIHLTLGETPASYANSGDAVSYTISLVNEGGTDATGLTLANPSVAGLSFGDWTCAATGATSACPNDSGTGAINETAIAIAAGGSVMYTLPGTVNVSSGNITDMVMVGPGGTICVAGVCSAQQVLSGP